MKNRFTAAALAAAAFVAPILSTPEASAVVRDGDKIDYSMSFGNTNPVVAYPGAPVHTDERPGDGYIHHHSCSLGPRATDGKTDKVFFAIAAHCVNKVGVDGTVFFDHNDAAAGKVRWIHPEYDDDAVENDMAVIEITDTDAVGYTSIIPNVNKAPSARGKSPMGNFSLKDFGDSHGSACSIGRKSDIRCGVAIGKDSDTDYSFTFASTEGDSGGVVFTADKSGKIYPLGVASATYPFNDSTMTKVADINLIKHGGYALWESRN